MLPNLLVIGAAKAGTTSLWRFLDEHPEVHMAPVKEVHFFDRDENWANGVPWYAEHFAGSASARVVGEATPAYSRFPHRPDAARRAAGVVPSAKLLYVVRQPVERARSHYLHEVRHQREELPFARAVVEHSLYLDASRYAMQLEQWARYFPRESIHVVQSELLRSCRPAVLRGVYEFLGVDPGFVPSSEELNTSAAYSEDRVLGGFRRSRAGRSLARTAPPVIRRAARRRLPHAAHAEAAAAELSPELREQLTEVLRSDVTALRAWMPPDFSAWGISDTVPAAPATSS